MDWVTIIMRVIAEIMESLEDRDPAEIAVRLKKPRGREALILRRILVREFRLSGRELRVACREGMDELRSALECEVDNLVADAVAMRAELYTSTSSTTPG